MALVKAELISQGRSKPDPTSNMMIDVDGQALDVPGILIGGGTDAPLRALTGALGGRIQDVQQGHVSITSAR